MNNSQMELMYRETYIRAYRLRHPRRNRAKLLSVVISTIIILALITTLQIMLEDPTVTYAKDNTIPALAKLAQVSLDEAITAVPKLSDTNTKQPVSESDTPDLEMLWIDTTSADADTQDPYMVESTDIMQLSHPVEDIAERERSEDVALRASLTEEELEFVERVVEAEVTGTTYIWNGEFVNEEEMLLSKIRVCQVFLNRAENTDQFSDVMTLYDAMIYPNASSTVLSGRCYDVEVTDLTREAVRIALDPNTEDLTDGALYFLADGATYCKYGDYMFTDSVGHSFFK